MILVTAQGKKCFLRESWHIGSILWWGWQDGLIVVVLLLLLVEDLKLKKELLLLQYFGIG